MLNGAGTSGQTIRPGVFFRRVDADLRELIEFACVNLHPVGGILLGLREICLDEMRDMVRRRDGHQIVR